MSMRNCDQSRRHELGISEIGDYSDLLPGTALNPGRHVVLTIQMSDLID